MMPRLRVVCLTAASFAVFLCAVLPCCAAELSTGDFSVVHKRVEAFAKEHGAGNVLLVCDIDNTLLAMNQDLGSNQWFDWQSGMIGKEPRPKAAVACDFDGLLRAQSLLFSLSDMHPPQTIQPDLIRTAQELGVITMAHTSRGPDFRDATLREFSDSSYDFSRDTISPMQGFAGSYLPYDSQNIVTSGLTQKEAESLIGVKDGKLKPPRPVSFNDGIYMTTGQHKGAMLRMLLHKSGNSGKFKALVFVDDTPKNTKAVRDAFADVKTMTTVTFLFTHEDEKVRQFNENVDGRRDLTVKQWRKLMRARSKIFK